MSEIDPTALQQLVEKRVTCPFVGSAVATGRLSIVSRDTNLLARIEDVRALGNTGGGDLGDVLAVFASGNHTHMLRPSLELAPEGLFSLDFPGSKGSHPGHSGILQGDPHELDSGRFSEPDFQRLASRAKEGLLRHLEVGEFIAENLCYDTNSKVFATAVWKDLARDLGHFAASVGKNLLLEIEGRADGAAHRDLKEKFTTLTGEDNLLGSCGEFGLLFAFFAHKPGAKDIAGGPALLVEDLRLMFREKRLPEGWDSWRKTRHDWLINSTALMISAAKAYLAQRKEHGTAP